MSCFCINLTACVALSKCLLLAHVALSEFFMASSLAYGGCRSVFLSRKVQLSDSKEQDFTDRSFAPSYLGLLFRCVFFLSYFFCNSLFIDPFSNGLMFEL